MAWGKFLSVLPLAVNPFNHLSSEAGLSAIMPCAPARHLVLNTVRVCRFFAVAFGFAFALFVSLICFNHISANMNPASVLGTQPIHLMISQQSHKRVAAGHLPRTDQSE